MGLRPLACWDYGFESLRRHGCHQCCVCQRSLLRADNSPGGIIPSAVCLSVVKEPQPWGGLGTVGSLTHGKGGGASIFLPLVGKYSEKLQHIWAGLEPGFRRNKGHLCFANRLGIRMIHTNQSALHAFNTVLTAYGSFSVWTRVNTSRIPREGWLEIVHASPSRKSELSDMRVESLRAPSSANSLTVHGLWWD